MTAWRGLSQYRRFFIVMGVAMAHALLAISMLPYLFNPRAFETIDALNIELAELVVPEPEPDSAPPPDVEPPATSRREAVPKPSRSEAPTSVTVVASAEIEFQPDAPKDSAPSSGQIDAPVEPILLDPQPNVLTQNTPVDDGIMGRIARSLEPVQPGTIGENTVSQGQIASVLAQSHCLKLKRYEEKECPENDPFESALANAKRAIPPERLFEDRIIMAQSVSDKLFEAIAAKRFLWPDVDLFEDPLAPGSYNARRIRSGREPLWSQEMKDGFRKTKGE